ncbi:hypothetical protein C4D60_Mb10t28780 [Musa balbisiana]|uniref:Uncharacterized protein n=1 Tax=Musa balbisiana TaxID=52838 RepID=A0A4S8J0K4_MUSBA|nr:hypothetical protein C4D60_Mb10t28780 [Musa balbisiana]
MAFTLSFSSSLFCLLGILFLHRATVISGCFSMEREALLDFKAGIHDTRNRLSSWTGHHCCTWKGVACDTTTGHVVMLDLRNTNITDDRALRGERMNSSLLALSHLEHLDLSFNDFSGIRIPEFISSFKKLRYLNLSSTKFMGGIPARVGNLSSLYVLDLGSNLFNGSMPSSIGKLSNLTVLYLGGNSLAGVISEVHFENLTRLQVLDLSYNPINISIGQSWVPPFQLRFVDLTKCQLGPQFPEWLQFQTQIQELYLADCKIAGTMPAWFWNISSSTIVFLDLSNNQIGGKLPSSFHSTKLERFHLESNRFEGPLPMMLPATLDTLFLSNNSYTGQLPIWPYVRFVSISDNMLDVWMIQNFMIDGEKKYIKYL